MKDYCFVAQPFDSDAYDDRYSDIIEPVVRSCGLECYRVDQDSAVDIPVFSMEDRIEKAKLVIVEISEDNPNVWYELGYASALGKPIIMVCSDERQPPYPFDVRHRSIVTYRTKSPKDFERYKMALRSAISCRYQISEQTENADALTNEELLVLKFIARDQMSIHAITPEEKILKANMDQDMVRDCLRALINRGYLEYNFSTEDRNNYYHVTPKADQLLFGR